MQISPNEILPMIEDAGGVCCLDTEATGLKGDYNSILVATLKPWHKAPISFVVDRPGDDRSVVCAFRDELAKYAVWVSYYGKMYDIPLLQSRLLFWRANPLVKKHHIDMYFTMKCHTLTARRSQAHLIEWLGTKNKKMTLSPDIWNLALSNPEKYLPVLKKRCEQDCAGLEGLYDRGKHLIADIKR